MWYRYLMDTIGWDVMKAACPTRQVLDRVADKWTMLVILALEQHGTLRFSELRRQVEGVTQKMLTQTVIATVPVTVNYTLTDLGHRLSTAVGVIREWAYDNIEQIESARTQFDAVSAATASA
jgi:DNA-binding HxlR family transcriptional regulator